MGRLYVGNLYPLSCCFFLCFLQIFLFFFLFSTENIKRQRQKRNLSIELLSFSLSLSAYKKWKVIYYKYKQTNKQTKAKRRRSRTNQKIFCRNYISYLLLRQIYQRQIERAFLYVWLYINIFVVVVVDPLRFILI